MRASQGSPSPGWATGKNMALAAEGGFRAMALFKWARLQLLADQVSGLYSCCMLAAAAAAAALLLSGAGYPCSAGDHLPKKEVSLELLPLVLPLVLLLLRGDMLHTLLGALPSASLVLMGMRCGGVGKPEENAGVLSALAASSASISAP